LEKTIDKLKSEPAPEILNQDINTPATPPSELQTPESGIPSTQVPQSSPTDTGMNPEN